MKHGYPANHVEKDKIKKGCQMLRILVTVASNQLRRTCYVVL